MLCILYVIAVGTCLGLAGLLVERTLPASWPRRWVWCVVIAISVTLPAVYQVLHSWSVVEALKQQEALPSLGHVFGSASLAALDPGWWERTSSYNSIIYRLWAIASAGLLVWGLVTAGWVSRVIRTSRTRHGDADGSTIVDGLPVFVTDSIGPATVGVWRSRVLVPRWVLALPRVQRQYVLRHEEEHRSAHDARLLFVASLTLILLPWNLALWWHLRRLRLAVEMDCDHRVVSALGDATAYGCLLLKIAQTASRGPRLQPAFLGGVGMLERRLTRLVAPKPLRDVQRFLLPAVACALLLAVLIMPHPVLTGRSTAHESTTSVSTMIAPKTHPAAQSIVTRRP